MKGFVNIDRPGNVERRRTANVRTSNLAFPPIAWLVYLAAFWSAATQILGLAGHNGILPADQYMTAAKKLDASAGTGFFQP